LRHSGRHSKRLKNYPEAKKALEKMHEVLRNIVRLAGCTPVEVGMCKDLKK